MLNKVKIEPNFLSLEACDFLRSFGEDNPSIFKDRKTFLPNYGIKRDLGNYVSCQFSRECFKDIFLKYLDIEYDGFPVKEIQLNKYEVGTFIPPHKDMQTSVHTIIVPLQDEDTNHLVVGDCKCYYDNMDLKESNQRELTKSFPDVKGRGYRFNGNSVVHWVPPVSSKRYSATFLYSF